MRRALRWLAIGLGVLVALPLLAAGGVVVALNTAPGQRLAGSLAARLTHGMVTVEGLGGAVPQAVTVRRITIADARGVWLTIEDAALDLSPAKLLSRDLRIDRLTAGHIAVARLPEEQPSGARTGSGGGGGMALPVRVDLERLAIARLEIAAPVAGTALALGVAGSAHLASLQAGDAAIRIRNLDGPGVYSATGRIDAARLAAKLSVAEQPGGLIESVAHLPSLGAIGLDAALDGPWSGAALRLSLSAGELRATAKGRIDLAGRAADLDIAATAPAMTPAPGIAWQLIALDAHTTGAFDKPHANARLHLARLAAGGATIDALDATVTGDLGALDLAASADGLRIPGPQPALLAAAPLRLEAHARLDDPARPVTFRLAHKLFDAAGSAQTGGDLSAEVVLTLPDLTKLAAVGGVELAGQARLDATAARHGETTRFGLDGTLGVTGGMAPIPALLGEATTIALAGSLRGADVTLDRLAIAGKTITLDAKGWLAAEKLDLAWTLALGDLAALAPSLAGRLAASGKLTGPTDDLTAAIDVKGEIAPPGMKPGAITLALAAHGLPGAPAGHLTAGGALDGAPLAVELDAARGTDGMLTFDLARATWRSVQADGKLRLKPGAKLPEGHVAVRAAALAELGPLVGQKLAGSVTANADLAASEIRLKLEARDAGLAGTAAIGHTILAATLRDPLGARALDATLTADGIDAAGITGAARLTARGTEAALAAKLSATLAGLAGADATIDVATMIDVPARRVTLAALDADWKNLALKLLAPARIDLAQGVAIDRLRLGLGQATIEVAGRASPTLDLTGKLANVTPDLARAVMPTLNAAGVVNAAAHLTGTPARPAGSVTLTATGLHLKDQPGSALPPADLQASAMLDGRAVQLRVRLAAGNRIDLAVNGSAPLSTSGSLDLRATGTLDLAVVNPILMASGRQVQGAARLDVGVAGTLAAPQLNGSATLAHGDLQDFALGAHLADIAARIEAAGQSIRIASLTARAGSGTISAAGSVGALAPGLPIDLAVTLRKARPLASDLITATLDADLAISGAVSRGLAAKGAIRIERAEIGVPETMPSSVAVLPVRRADAPPPAAAAGPDVAFDLDLSVPGAVFVHGRGLDVELGGKLHVGGTAAKPLPSGGFDMRRGQFSLAGTTLAFTKGDITFNGSRRLDPALDFVATSTAGNVVATLAVGGYASAPTITLSSAPELPQDQILAYLLFHQSSSGLSAFQLAEIGAAVAQLSGAGGVGDPLNGIRKTLGLDTLSLGSQGAVQGATAGTAAATQNANAPALQAGRYIAPGVYLGAKQDVANGGDTQAELSIDLTKHLKLKTDAGSGLGANAVGLSYQFQY